MSAKMGNSKSIRRLHQLVIILFLIFCFPFAGIAAPKKKKKKKQLPPIVEIQPGDVFDVTVNIEYKAPEKKKKKKKKKKKSGKKKVRSESVTISCYDKVPGLTSQEGDKLFFSSFTREIKKLKKNKRNSPAGLRLKALLKAGTTKCESPTFLSLDRYQGTFGEAEARLLLNRFALGATPERIAQAVQEGLQQTVVNLTTYISHPSIDVADAELMCDGRMADDPENEGCDSLNPNDVYPNGVRYSFYHRFEYSPSPFFEKLFLFLHDERMTASLNAVGGSERHAIKKHIDLIRRAATTGDYTQFLRDWNSDHLGHLNWLDGATNKGQSPNENYAREFWELGSTGPTDLDGNPVYSDLDLAQSALAFSGWTTVRDEFEDSEGDSHSIYYAAFSDGLHAPGAKTIFNGTPYQATVYNGEDVLRATLAHPRTAEHLAEDLWKEFVNPFATPTAIRRLANVIRENNYNLIPVLRKLMVSEALYAARSRNTLIKHPIELYFGLVKATDWPVEYSTMDYHLGLLNQRPFLPATVFGWDEKQLAGESYVFDWRDVVVRLFAQGKNSLEEQGYDIYTKLLPGQPTSMEVVDRFSSLLGLELNPNQKQVLDDYLNYSLIQCRSYHVEDYGCEVGKLFQWRDAFDSHPQAEGGDWKAKGLLTILATLPQYRVK